MRSKIFLALSVFALVAIIFALLKPMYVEVPPERMAASRLFFATLDARQLVQKNIQQSGTINGSGRNLAYPSINDKKHGEMVWIISENGTIVGSNKKHNLTITLTPALKNGKTVWSCRFKPRQYAPGICKQ